MARIDIGQLTKQFGPQPVIQGVDLTIEDGEFMVLVGPSGCGKSTFLRLLAGLEQPSSGHIQFDGQRVDAMPAAQRGAAMVFQSYALYPHMTVAQNMDFGLRMSGVSKSEREVLVGQTAAKLQLTDLLQRYPKQLSGGQRQRVAIGRAIVRRPRVFLFDEPLSNLDAALRVQMRIELARLHADLGTTMVYVTHDQTEAMTLGHRIAVFNRGRIEQVGRPMDLYQSPVNRFVAEFLGSPKINVLPYRLLDAAHLQVGEQIVDLTMAPQSLLRRLSRGHALGVRPEAMNMGAESGSWRGRIEFIESLGDVQMVYLSCAGVDEALRVKVADPATHLQVGQALWCTPDWHRVMVFDRDGVLLD